MLVFVIVAAEEAEIKVEHLTAQHKHTFRGCLQVRGKCPWTVMHMNYALDAHDGPESYIRRKIKTKTENRNGNLGTPGVQRIYPQDTLNSFFLEIRV